MDATAIGYTNLKEGVEVLENILAQDDHDQMNEDSQASPKYTRETSSLKFYIVPYITERKAQNQNPAISNPFRISAHSISFCCTS